MQRKTQPDAGGTDEEFQEVQEAILKFASKVRHD
jgi:hypothetical protein